MIRHSRDGSAPQDCPDFPRRLGGRASRPRYQEGGANGQRAMGPLGHQKARSRMSAHGRLAEIGQAQGCPSTSMMGASYMLFARLRRVVRETLHPTSVGLAG
jgi:hypothetical protein